MMTPWHPDSKVHGVSMGPIWGRQDPGEPHVGPMNFAIWDMETFHPSLCLYEGNRCIWANSSVFDNLRHRTPCLVNVMQNRQYTFQIHVLEIVNRRNTRGRNFSQVVSIYGKAVVSSMIISVFVTSPSVWLVEQQYAKNYRLLTQVKLQYNQISALVVSCQRNPSMIGGSPSQTEIRDTDRHTLCSFMVKY